MDEPVDGGDEDQVLDLIETWSMDHLKESPLYNKFAVSTSASLQMPMST